MLTFYLNSLKLLVLTDISISSGGIASITAAVAIVEEAAEVAEVAAVVVVIVECLLF